MGPPSYCFFCSCLVNSDVPWIRCQECEKPVILCVDCFRKGVQQDNHKNCHAYTVMLGQDWEDSSLRSDMDLLSALEKCGYGNWEEVARHLPQLTARQAKRLYDSKYLNEEGKKGPVDRKRQFPLISPMEDPPRLLPRKGSESRLLAGYNPARGEFLVPYDNAAEYSLSQCAETDPSDELYTELCLALGDAYNSRLANRRKVERLVREHSLLHSSKVAKDLLYLREETTVPWLPERWKRFYQICCSADLDMLLSGLVMEAKVKQKVLRLQQFRREGLQLCGSVPLFERLKRRRQEQQVEISEAEQELECFQTIRKSALPLEIVGLPGYSSLTLGARNLCSELRMTPVAFLEAKELLENEIRTKGGLKLSEARQLLKIDVNRTRKLYDFLVPLEQSGSSNTTS